MVEMLTAKARGDLSQQEDSLREFILQLQLHPFAPVEAPACHREADIDLAAHAFKTMARENRIDSVSFHVTSARVRISQ